MKYPPRSERMGEMEQMKLETGWMILVLTLNAVITSELAYANHLIVAIVAITIAVANFVHIRWDTIATKKFIHAYLT